MSFSDFSKQSIQNHLAVSICVASLNVVSALANGIGIANLLYYQRNLLKKQFYRLFLASMIIGCIGNLLCLFKIATDNFVDFGIAPFIILNGLYLDIIVIQSYALWLQFWTLLNIFTVLDAWLGKFVKPYYYFSSIFAFIQFLGNTIMGVYEISVNELALGVIAFHAGLFLLYAVYLIGSALALLFYLHHLLAVFHREKKCHDEHLITRLKRTTLFGAAVVGSTCLPIITLFFDFSYFYEVCSVEIFILSLVPPILAYGYTLTVSIALAKKRDSMEATNRSENDMVGGKPIMLIDLVKHQNVPNMYKDATQATRAVFSTQTVKMERSRYNPS